MYGLSRIDHVRDALIGARCPYAGAKGHLSVRIPDAARVAAGGSGRPRRLPEGRGRGAPEVPGRWAPGRAVRGPERVAARLALMIGHMMKFPNP
ncbi:hypothetical protein GCM10025734_52090 [Kitasatospora paranensis]